MAGLQISRWVPPLVLAGAGAYSLDNVLLKRNPGLADRAWFRWLSGSLPLPLTDTGVSQISGSRFWRRFLAIQPSEPTAIIAGRLSRRSTAARSAPRGHHFALGNGALLPDGGVKFQIYLDGGTPEAPAHIMKAELIGGENEPLETWNTETLTRLPADSIHNDFAYNKFKAGPYGIVAEMGAMGDHYVAAGAERSIRPRVGTPF